MQSPLTPWRMYSGIIIIDGNRIRFSVEDWKTMIVLKRLRTELRGIMSQSFRTPGRDLSGMQQQWLDIWYSALSAQAQ